MPLADMSSIKPNASRFSFAATALKNRPVQVLRFTGEEMISQPYAFAVVLLSERADIDASSLINQAATLTIDREGVPVPICGVVTAVTHSGCIDEGHLVEVELRPRVWRLSLSTQSRVYQQMSVEEIIREVLRDNGLSASDVRFHLSHTYAPRSYCVQYDETDLCFIQRLVEFEGIAYHFDHSTGNDVLVFTDSRAARRKIGGRTVVEYASGSGLLRDCDEHVESFVCKQRVVPGMVTLDDYASETPDVNLQVEAKVSANMPGETYRYGAKYGDAERGKRLAEIRAEEIRCRETTCTGVSDCAGLASGYLFSLQNHHVDALNQDYLVTRIRHEGAQHQALGITGLHVSGQPRYAENAPESASEGDDASTSTYVNRFTAVPASVQFRPRRRTKVPEVPSLMTARIESAGGSYAYIDDDGRYRARMHFDRSGSSTGSATKPIRMATPSSGPNYGMHFPNHAGTEVVVGFINGDIDRPLALGTVPNASQKSPATSGNRMHNVLRTFGGNEFVMDDTSGETVVRLRSAGSNALLLDDKDESIRIQTAGDHTVVLDDAKERIEIRTPAGYTIVLDDAEKAVRVASRKGHCVRLSDKDDSLTLADATGEHILQLDYKNEVMTLATPGSICLEAGKAVEVKGESILIESQNNVVIDAGGTIDQTAGADAKMTAGGNAELSAGADVEVEGGAKVALRSPQIVQAARTQMEITGQMVSISAEARLQSSGKAIHMIKGGVVQVMKE